MLLTHVRIFPHATVRADLTYACDQVVLRRGARLAAMSLSDTDLTHLRRCVELAREGLDDGDEPFGSVLVDAAGVLTARRRSTGPSTASGQTPSRRARR